MDIETWIILQISDDEEIWKTETFPFVPPVNMILIKDGHKLEVTSVELDFDFDPDTVIVHCKPVHDLDVEYLKRNGWRIY